VDVVYLALVVGFWLLLVGMAEGCAKLGRPAQWPGSICSVASCRWGCWSTSWSHCCNRRSFH